MNVVLTLTTIPSRLLNNTYGDDGIKSCIQSLQNQNYSDYEIHFNIPYINKLTSEEYIIPDWLEEYDKIKVFRVDDLGPATKLVETVQRIQNPNTIIIVCDDDLVYHPDMIAEHVKNQSTRDFIFGYDALGTYEPKFDDVRDYYVVSVPFEMSGKVMQHYKTVSYKRKYFKADFFDFVRDNYSWSDDLLISAYMQKNKIPRIVMPYEGEEKLLTLEQWQNRGGVSTFPVIKHTAHEAQEGCNTFRQNKVDDNGSKLYFFIDTPI